MTSDPFRTIAQLPSCLFDQPRRLLQPAWAGHLPFLAFLMNVLRPRRFVELGVYCGDSYCYACQTRSSLGLETECVGIDSWEGDAHTGTYGEDVYSGLKGHHDAEYAEFSSLRRSLFEKQLPTFDDESIDLLHIDGEHTYDAVSRDFHTWLPKVATGGVVLLHDTEVVVRQFGVRKLWEELAPEWPTFRFTHCHGLGVLFKGAAGDVPESLRGLFSSHAREQETIRSFFAAAGGSYVYEANLRRRGHLPQESPGLNAAATTLREYDRILGLLSRSKLRKLRYVLTGRI